MKKIFYFLAAAALFTCCNDDDPEPTPPGPPVPPGPDDPVELATMAAEVVEGSVTFESASVKFTPSVEDAQYFADLWDASDLVGLSEENIVHKAQGMPDFDSKLHTGVATVDFTGLSSSKQYFAVAFAWDGEKAGAVSHDVTLTTTEPVINLNINIRVTNVTQTSAEITYESNLEDVRYYARLCTGEELEVFGLLGQADAEIIKYLMENVYADRYVRTGEYYENPTNLQPGATYYAVAFDFEKQDKLFYKEFETQAGALNSDFTVTNVTPDFRGATCHVVPGDKTKPWYYVVMEKEKYEEYGQGVMARAYYQLHNSAIAKGYEAMGAYLSAGRAKTGEADLEMTDSPYTYDLMPDKDYVGLIFYVDLTQEDPTYVYDYAYQEVPFHTLAPSLNKDPEIEISNIVVAFNDAYTYSISFTLKSNENVKTIKYGFGTWAQVSPYLTEGPDGKYDWSAVSGYAYMYISSSKVEESHTAEGTVISLPGFDARYDGKDCAFVFRAENDEGKAVFDGIHVDPSYFE